MADSKEKIELAEILYPQIKKSITDYEKKYPVRNLDKDAKVTRFAPSPTGFLHIGSAYTSLINMIVAKQSNGVFFLRIEDTDKKREIEGGVDELIRLLAQYNIHFDEGFFENKDKGNYGPYKQSEREEIYLSFVKYLVQKDLAYPCFLTDEEIENIRKEQEKMSVQPGIYGIWAKHRSLSIKEIKEKLDKKIPFTLRLKAPQENKKIIIKDLIRGDMEVFENNLDIVLIKSGGLPTYHLAHVVDDHLMRTTTVIRGDEWLSSTPLHVQLFDMFGFKIPEYAHVSPIQKMDGESRRKISKRKDPEASVKYYEDCGYPIQSVQEYLINLANSDFEDWRKANPLEPFMNFNLKISKMGKSGALFDEAKLLDTSRNVIGLMDSKLIYDLCLAWAEGHDSKLYELLKNNKEYTIAILNIEKNPKNPRKDLAKWSEFIISLGYLYDAPFKDEIKSRGYVFEEGVKKEDALKIIKEYSQIFNTDLEKDAWFEQIRELAAKLGYAKNAKEYSKSPDQYKGSVTTIAQIIRVALTNRTNTPDMYGIMRSMGKNKVVERFEMCLKNLDR